MHVPGWHEATKALQDEGKLQMVGIIEEQHPDRARLFMQWKRMGWPILVDALDRMNVSYVPMTLAIDEHGVIRKVGLTLADAKDLENTFLERQYEAPATGPMSSTPGANPVAGKARRSSFRRLSVPDLDAMRPTPGETRAARWRDYADGLILWAGQKRLDEAIGACERALALDPDDGMTHFRRGVALRRRYDSAQRRPGDFQNAVREWAKALDLDPNNYIWRRRIQQYGPRLDKPYPFYDWVTEARDDIVARGERPVPLAVEPGGAELAHPEPAFTPAAGPEREPDPRGTIARDPGRFIRVETTVTPPAIAPGSAARVLVTFEPDSGMKAHWNNEVTGLAFWVDPPDGWQVGRRLLTLSNPPSPISQETRTIELEVKAAPGAASESRRFPAYALYYVCEGVKGTCLYRRQDIDIRIDVEPATKPRP